MTDVRAVYLCKWACRDDGMMQPQAQPLSAHGLSVPLLRCTVLGLPGGFPLVWCRTTGREHDRLTMRTRLHGQNIHLQLWITSFSVYVKPQPYTQARKEQLAEAATAQVEAVLADEAVRVVAHTAVAGALGVLLRVGVVGVRHLPHEGVASDHTGRPLRRVQLVHICFPEAGKL